MGEPPPSFLGEWRGLVLGLVLGPWMDSFLARMSAALKPAPCFLFALCRGLVEDALPILAFEPDLVFPNAARFKLAFIILMIVNLK